MPSLFVDTSALVKFYYPETGSDRVESLLLEAECVYLSQLAAVEMASALSKKVRMGDLSKQRERVLWKAFLDDLDTDKIALVSLEDQHYIRAADLIREFGGRYGIKTLDALQLALAHSLRHSLFLSADKNLARIASRMGIRQARL